MINKKQTILIAVAALIVLAFGSAFYVAYFKSSSYSGSNISLLTVVDSAVQTKSPDQSTFSEVDGSQQIQEGWVVKTSATGRAILEGQGATTAIDKNTELTLKKQSTNQSVIQLTLGNVWANVVKKTSEQEGYEIHTPNAVAVVRGTSFGVSYANHITIILVQEGIVGVISINPIDGKQVGQEVLVTAGKKAIVEDGKEPVVMDAQTSEPPQVQIQQKSRSSTPIPTISPPGTPSTTIKEQPTSTPELKSASPSNIPTSEPTPNTNR